MPAYCNRLYKATLPFSVSPHHGFVGGKGIGIALPSSTATTFRAAVPCRQLLTGKGTWQCSSDNA
uniref:Uncharacterized protein n=1 Tax=Oryza meridionalis TaxID=40149 RepID=A0A0E0DX51_9ORYZ